ncbi:nucleoside-diphosphate-sugar epimerase [Actinoplanes lutulentus]|uniref:Nucleoside-diphosphate-sugar epimerase n=1 Tax=Actinoplanes lutulentus TaxID=1287878 RepID=A0A327Z811_9ACTN|nr:aldehyde reductase [Actinoplanes lutulentus]MBB2949139.1 nucleoside-diphosphate-sugar epimerase [Actinoplanes lutulentus]RAK31460.1 nucleoside-diphosphate-sugar epimerase [Actinoplanes lutulentus]
MAQKRVLVTGGSGFIAGHIIVQLLEQGFQVRTTVRSLQRENAVRAVLAEAGMVHGEALSFAAADLLGDAGWAEAVAGCDYVLHVASPVHPGHVEDEDAVIVPARAGTMRVLRAARAAGVERVVLTSAFHAISWGHPHRDRAFTEDDWTVLDGPGVDAYARSKTLAERDAWDFIDAEGGGMDLVVLCPVAVVGPVMGRGVSGANHVVQRILSGGMPGFPDMYIPFVDVRDVAAAHILAMVTPGAAGQRFLISNGPAIALKKVGELLKNHLGAAAGKVPARGIPHLVVRLGALFKPEFRALVPDLGYVKKTSNAKAGRILGWTPRPVDDALLDAARSMLAKGLVA